MKLIHAIFPLVILIAVYSVQAISISGIVKSSDGIGLEGVRVKLGKANITTTTASDGSFLLTENSATGILPELRHAAIDNECPFSLVKNRLFLRSSELIKVNVTVYNCNGKVLFSLGKTLLGEDHSITIPQFGCGIQIYRVSADNVFFTFKCIAGMAAEYSPASPSKYLETKQAHTASRIDDALLFIKQGYQYNYIIMTKPDTSGLQITMVPLDTGTVKDADGNVYKTVRIGNQYWTAENLRTTKYNDGSSIGSACYYYKNTTDAAAKKKWGALYTDAAANSGKLAPTGWRVPTGADWDTLVNYLISHGYNYDGSTREDMTAKAIAASTDWPTSTDSGAIGNDLSLNNASGFSALPAGWKYFEFQEQGNGAYWWIAGKGSENLLDVWWVFRSINRYSTINFGASVRLVRHI